jgi:hypothetical protein
MVVIIVLVLFWVIWDGCGFKVVMRRLGESRVGHGGEDG